MPWEPTPGLVTFVGLFVAALFGFGSLLAWVSAPGVGVVRGLALTLAGVGLLVAVVALTLAVVLSRR